MISSVRSHHQILIALLVVIGTVTSLIALPKASAPAGTSNPTKDTSGQTASDSTAPTSPAPSPNVLAAPPVPPACEHVSLNVAKLVLGGNPTPVENETSTLASDMDMRVDQCTYRSSESTLRVTAFAAKSSVGRSTNAITFGSGRPSGVQNEPSYGQSAYWNASTGILSVLKDNNRYDISRTGGYDAVKKAADAVVPKL